MKILKSAFKFINRNKLFTSINVLGLSLALSISFIMGLYIVNEFSYNSTHKNRKNVYRVVNYYKPFDKKLAGTPFPLAEDLKATFPQIKNATNVRRIRGASIKLDDNWLNKSVLATSTDMFDIFTIPIISQTTQDDLLQSLNDIVISEKVAELIFKDGNPLGKEIIASIYGEENVFNVTAVFEELPLNSSLQADCFVNNHWTLNDINKAFNIDNASTSYRTDTWTTWIKTAQSAQIQNITKGLDDFVIKQTQDSVKTYSLQSLSDFYLHSNNILNSGKTGSLKSLKIVGLIALLIIIVATLNYITLSSAISTNRMKEIGVRKTNGASITNIRNQLLNESVIIALICLPIALLLISIMKPYAESLFEQRFLLISNNAIYYILCPIILTILIGLLSGLYSSSYLSKLKTIDIIHKKPFIGEKKNGFQSMLIVFQLIVFCVFVASAFIIHSQYKYGMNKDLGYHKSNILFVDLNDEADYKVFLERVKTIPQVISVSGSMDILPTLSSGSFMLNHFINKDEQLEVEGLDIDYNFLQTMGIKLKEGRYFSEEYATDFKHAIILNQTAVEQLGIENPVGQIIEDWTIIGVVEDFIVHSIHSNIPPLIISLTDEYINQVAILYQEGELFNLLSILKKEWQSVNKDIPFIYLTIDDINEEIYASEKTFFKIITIGSIFTLIIAMLGLFGLTLFITKSRTKEIGIRKVVGSSKKEIVLLLLKTNIYNVIIASVIALPISYFIMKEWLQNYAYAVEINFWHFVISSLIALVLVVITVIVQAYAAANKNPIIALRYE